MIKQNGLKKGKNMERKCWKSVEWEELERFFIIKIQRKFKIFPTPPFQKFPETVSPFPPSKQSDLTKKRIERQGEEKEKLKEIIGMGGIGKKNKKEK